MERLDKPALLNLTVQLDDSSLAHGVTRVINFISFLLHENRYKTYVIFDEFHKPDRRYKNYLKNLKNKLTYIRS